MNKRSVRSFALGILFAVMILSGSYIWIDLDESPTLEEAKRLVEEEGLVIITEEEYDSLSSTPSPPDDTADEKEEPVHEEPAEEEQADSNQTIIEYELEIQAGMNSSDIAETLFREKVIDDEHDFEQYLIDHDYNRRMQIGSFTLTNDMSYEQIAKIITKTDD